MKADSPHGKAKLVFSSGSQSGQFPSAAASLVLSSLFLLALPRKLATKPLTSHFGIAAIGSGVPHSAANQTIVDTSIANMMTRHICMSLTRFLPRVTVQRLVSKGRDILRIKRSFMSNENVVMFIFISWAKWITRRWILILSVSIFSIFSFMVLKRLLHRLCHSARLSVRPSVRYNFPAQKLKLL